MNPADERKLFSPEAELAVIGGLIIDPTHLPAIRERLAAQHFVDVQHRMIWQTVLTVHDLGLTVDLVTVMDQMEAEGYSPEAMAYLVKTVRETPSSANVESYAKLVCGYAIRRKIAALSESMGQWAYQERDAGGLVGKAREALDRIEGFDPQAGPRKVGEVMQAAMTILDERMSRPPGLTGLSTGLVDLDRILDGLQSGRLYVVAARPAMGKSILAMQCAREAVKKGSAVAFFSLEMPAEELANRLWAAEQRIEYGRIQSAQLQPAELTQICDFTVAMTNTLLWIDDTADLSFTELTNRAHRLHHAHPLSLLVVDYIGLLKGPKTYNREQEVAAMSRAFKSLAKELKIPVMVVAQLNRMVEGRTDKRPQLADLRDSGQLEADADVVLMLYRDEVYNPDSLDKGCAEILIRKQRAGPIGLVATQFQGEFCRFNSLLGGLPSAQQPGAASGGWTVP
jgi:replicative DNA helicase